MGRSRSRSPARRERRRSRSGSRERRRSRSRSRDRRRRSPVNERRRSRSPKGGRRRTSPRRARSSSNSPSRGSSKAGGSSSSRNAKNEPRVMTEEDLEGKTEEEIEMMKIMGFSEFDSTKGRKVEGSANAYAINVSQKRKYRQYMNRKGGFNRPLDFVA